MFSAITSIPDVNVVRSASRNPLAVRQGTILNECKDHRKLYFLGGSASWGNIRGDLTHNFPDLELHEEGDYDAARVDVWGISDLDLVRSAHSTLASLSGDPFIAVIQTADNHRPWTIPPDCGDFAVAEGLDDARLLAAGFDEGIDEFNAARFMDYCIGELIALAREEAYFENTVFFFFGDHGVRFPEGDPPLPGLDVHHVPLLIYSPKLLPESRRIETIASSLDVMPTAAGLAGIGYRNDTMGRDLFTTERAPFAFLRFASHGGLVGKDLLLEPVPDGTTRLFAYQSDAPRTDVTSAHPGEAASMARLAAGLMETARYLLFRGHPGED